MATKTNLTNLIEPAEYSRNRYVVDLRKRTPVPAEDELYEPGFWKDLSQKLVAGDHLVAKIGGGKEIDLRVVRVLDGGAVVVARATADGELVDDSDGQPRHIIVCRRRPDVTHEWGLAEKFNGQWHDIWAGASTLEAVVRGALSQLVGTDFSIWPDITIAGVALEELDGWYPPAGHQSQYTASHRIIPWARDRSLVVVAPIGYEHAPEQWAFATRSCHSSEILAATAPLDRFVTSRVTDRVLQLFTPSFKDFAARAWTAETIMIRPHWRMREIVPFPEPTGRVMSDEAMARYREADQFEADRRDHWRQHISQGREWDAERLSWRQAEDN